MKKILLILCILLLVFVFTGCEEKKETNGGYVDISADMNETEKSEADVLKAVYNGFPLGLIESIVKEADVDVATIIINEAKDINALIVDEIIVKDICGYNEGRLYAVGVTYTNGTSVNDLIIIENEKIIFQPIYDDDEQEDIIDTIDALNKKVSATFNAINTKLGAKGEKIQTVLSAKQQIIVINDSEGNRLKLPSEPVYEKDYFYNEEIIPDFADDVQDEEIGGEDF